MNYNILLYINQQSNLLLSSYQHVSEQPITPIDLTDIQSLTPLNQLYVLVELVSLIYNIHKTPKKIQYRIDEFNIAHKSQSVVLINKHKSLALHIYI